MHCIHCMRMHTIRMYIYIYLRVRARVSYSGGARQDDEDALDEDVGTVQAGGSLLPPLTIKRQGVTTVSILIERIGLKDAQTYIEPRMTVSLVGTYTCGGVFR